MPWAADHGPGERDRKIEGMGRWPGEGGGHPGEAGGDAGGSDGFAWPENPRAGGDRKFPRESGGPTRGAGEIPGGVYHPLPAECY